MVEGWGRDNRSGPARSIRPRCMGSSPHSGVWGGVESRQGTWLGLTRDSSDPRSVSVPHLLIFLLVWLLVQTGITVAQHPEVLTGSQIDTDGHLRMVRVGLLFETGAWFDGSIPRSNWPFGEVHHWTRPLDVVILLLAVPFSLFLEPHAALAVAGALVSPLFHLGICIAAVWIVKPLVPGPERFLAMPAMLVQLGVLAYGTAGRADHHALIFFLYALALGFWIRVLLDPERRAPALAAGALSGIGIWVSPEALLPLALLFVSGGIAWILEGGRFVRANLRLCMGLVAALLVAIPLERPPSAWFVTAFDRISVAHLTMALLATGFWWAVATLYRDTEREEGEQGRAGVHPTLPQGSWRRLATAGVGALVTVGLLRLIHPRFFRGPWVDVDPAVIDVWLRYVNELQPLFPQGWGDVGVFLMHLGAALVIMPALIFWSWKGAQDPRRPVWVLFLLSLVVYVPLAAYQVRFSGYAGVILALSMVILIGPATARASSVAHPGLRRMARVGVMGAVLLGPVGAGAAAELLHAAAAQPTDHPAGERDEGCSLSRMARVLAEPTGFGAQPRTIAAYIDFGPELLYRTPHRVLAGPYHRNAQGILGAYRFMTATDDQMALALAQEREVDWILVCPRVDRAYFGRGGDEALYNRLLDDGGPAWIEAVELPPEAPGGFRLFQVRRQPTAGLPGPGSAGERAATPVSY